MPTNYPTTLDSWSAIGPATYEDDSGFEHDGWHNNHADAIEKLEEKLGTGASVAAANQVLRGTGAGATGFGTIDKNYIDNRTRSLFLPAGAFDIHLGTPAYAGDAYGGWLLADAAVQYVSSGLCIPKDWASGALSIMVYWTKAAAGSGNVLFDVRTSGPFADGATLANTGTSDTKAVPSGTDELDIFTATESIDAPAGADLWVAVSVGRVGNDAADTYTGSVRFLGVRIDYTADM